MSKGHEYSTIATLGKHFGASDKALLILSNLKMEPVRVTRAEDGTMRVNLETRVRIAGAMALADTPGC